MKTAYDVVIIGGAVIGSASGTSSAAGARRIVGSVDSHSECAAATRSATATPAVPDASPSRTVFAMISYLRQLESSRALRCVRSRGPRPSLVIQCSEIVNQKFPLFRSSFAPVTRISGRAQVAIVINSLPEPGISAKSIIDLHFCLNWIALEGHCGIALAKKFSPVRRQKLPTSHCPSGV